LEHSGAELLVAPPSLGASGRELVGEGRIVERTGTGTSGSLEAPARNSSDDLLNLVYTSGSTGLPKGVIQTHRNVLFETAAGTKDMGTLPTDRFGLVMPLTMGGSISDLLGSILNGAALHIFDFRNLGAAALAQWILDEAINATHMAPTVFRRWMAELDPDTQYPEVRAVKLGGER
jgi:acyl-coenzyme A synthetase/AMP-(fatty) acid ligase